MVKTVQLHKIDPDSVVGSGGRKFPAYHLRGIFTIYEGLVFYCPDYLKPPYTRERFIEEWGDRYVAHVPGNSQIEILLDDAEAYLSHLKYRKDLAFDNGWRFEENTRGHMDDIEHYYRESDGSINVSHDGTPMMAWLFENDPDKPEFTDFFMEHWKFFDGIKSFKQGMEEMLALNIPIPQALLRSKGFEQLNGRWVFGGLDDIT